MKVSLKNMGTVNRNIVTLSTEKGSVALAFSYETVIAVDGIVAKNVWSNTTGKFLNELEPDKKNRVDPNVVDEEVTKRLAAIL